MNPEQIKQMIETITVYVCATAAVIAFVWRAFNYFELKAKESSVGATKILEFAAQYQKLEQDLKKIDERDREVDERLREDIRELSNDLKELMKILWRGTVK